LAGTPRILLDIFQSVTPLTRVEFSPARVVSPAKMVSSQTVLVFPVLAGEHDVFWAEDDVFAGEHGETSSPKTLQRED